MNRTLLALISAVTLLPACTAYDDTDTHDSADTDLYADMGLEEVRTDALVLNVFPPPTSGDGALQPHSFSLEAGTDGEVVLRPSVDWFGEVTGVVTPSWAAPQVPGHSEPIAASVRVWKPTTVQDRRTDTEPTTGSFELSIVPDSDYRVAVVPESVDVPFHSLTLDTLSAAPRTLELGAGTAIYGSVRFSTGAAIAGASVYALDSFGVAGPAAVTDAQGNYQLRVTEGTHRVISRGRDNGRDPTVRSAWIEVPAQGAAVDFDYPPLSLVTIGGRVENHQGAPVDNVTVRLRSIELDGFQDDASHEQRVRTNGAGLFDTRVAPGLWQIDILGEQGQSFTPVSLGEFDVSDTLDVGAVRLPALRPIQGRVTDPSGATVPDVSVRATEIGFGARTWTTSTDPQGLFTMQLPDVPMEFVLVPPAARVDVALTRIGAQPGPQGNIALSLTSGVSVGGTVLWQDGKRQRELTEAVLEIRDLDGRLWAVGTTDREGRWRLAVDPER